MSPAPSHGPRGGASGLTRDLEREVLALAEKLNEAADGLRRFGFILGRLNSQMGSGPSESHGHAHASVHGHGHAPSSGGGEARPRVPSLADPIDALAYEIDEAEQRLIGIGKPERNAHLRAWAGRARLLQDRIRAEGAAASPMRRAALRAVFGRLTRISREQPCGWVDALSEQWTADWEVYIKAAQGAISGTKPDLTPDQEKAYYQALLEGLFHPARRIDVAEVVDLVRDASKAVPADDPSLVKAMTTFGNPEEMAAKVAAARAAR